MTGVARNALVYGCGAFAEKLENDNLACVGKVKSGLELCFFE
jgi:hypothetical protein